MNTIPADDPVPQPDLAFIGKVSRAKPHPALDYSARGLRGAAMGLRPRDPAGGRRTGHQTRGR
jgi:hypothetical protein